MSKDAYGSQLIWMTNKIDKPVLNFTHTKKCVPTSTHCKKFTTQHFFACLKNNLILIDGTNSERAVERNKTTRERWNGQFSFTLKLDYNLRRANNRIFQEFLHGEIIYCHGA